ncbi:hypothetical protein DFJ74DRAFT_76433 [Hyaloraphidium curvatum]|nr:hypothetical protein DFJ74DRAFT_76433 [Hyaloraphidium curvatum]
MEQAKEPATQPTFTEGEWLAILPWRTTPLSPLVVDFPAAADPAAAARTANPLTRASLARTLGSASPLLRRMVELEFAMEPISMRPLLKYLPTLFANLFGYYIVLYFNALDAVFGQRQLAAGCVTATFFLIAGSALYIHGHKAFFRARAAGALPKVDDRNGHVFAGLARWIELVSSTENEGTGSVLVTHDSNDQLCPCPSPGCAGGTAQTFAANSVQSAFQPRRRALDSLHHFCSLLLAFGLGPSVLRLYLFISHSVPCHKQRNALRRSLSRHLAHGSRSAPRSSHRRALLPVALPRCAVLGWPCTVRAKRAGTLRTAPCKPGFWLGNPPCERFGDEDADIWAIDRSDCYDRSKHHCRQLHSNGLPALRCLSFHGLLRGARYARCQQRADLAHRGPLPRNTIGAPLCPSARRDIEGRKREAYGTTQGSRHVAVIVLGNQETYGTTFRLRRRLCRRPKYVHRAYYDPRRALGYRKRSRNLHQLGIVLPRVRMCRSSLRRLCPMHAWDDADDDEWEWLTMKTVVARTACKCNLKVATSKCYELQGTILQKQ